MHTFWRIWCDARTQQKAIKLYNRVIDALGCEAMLRSIKPYPKINGFVIDFELPLTSQTWNDAVMEAIQLGQCFAAGWQLSGNIAKDPDASSNQSSVSGVVMAQWWLVRDRAEWGQSPDERIDNL